MPLQFRSRGEDDEPYIFYDTWLTRAEAIKLIKSKDNTEELQGILYHTLTRNDDSKKSDFLDFRGSI